MSYRLAKLIGYYFPGHWITPLYFRRNSVTAVTKVNLTGQSNPVLAEAHAMLINTSPAVMRQHYDRFNRSKVNQDTLKMVNQFIGVTPGAALSEFLERQKARFSKQAEDTEKPVKRIIDHDFTAPMQVFYTVEHVDGSTSRVPALQMLSALHHVEVYLAKIGGFYNNPKLSYKNVTSKGFSIKKLIDEYDKKAEAGKKKPLEKMLGREARRDDDDSVDGERSEDDFCDGLDEVVSFDDDDDDESSADEEVVLLPKRSLRDRSGTKKSPPEPSAKSSTLGERALPPVDCAVVIESFVEKSWTVDGDDDGYDSDWMFDCDFDENRDYSRPPPKKKQKIN